MTEGTLPRLIVVFSVPEESARGYAGERDPRGLDLGDTCSGRRIASFILPPFWLYKKLTRTGVIRFYL